MPISCLAPYELCLYISPIDGSTIAILVVASTHAMFHSLIPTFSPSPPPQHNGEHSSRDEEEKEEVEEVGEVARRLRQMARVIAGRAKGRRGLGRLGLGGR